MKGPLFSMQMAPKWRYRTSLGEGFDEKGKGTCTWVFEKDRSTKNGVNKKGQEQRVGETGQQFVRQ